MAVAALTNQSMQTIGNTSNPPRRWSFEKIYSTTRSIVVIVKSQVPSVAKQSPDDAVVVSELEQISQVDAVYAGRDEEGVLHIYAVISEHEEAVYEQLLDAEARLIDQLKPMPVSLHIRAHQGRNPRMAVPFGSDPLYLR